MPDKKKKKKEKSMGQEVLDNIIWSTEKKQEYLDMLKSGKKKKKKK